MATGFIGTSTVTTTSTPITGPTLSYTCPASGVRYAVVTITARIYANGVTSGTGSHAGQLYWFPTTSSDIYKESIYTTILGPGQNWAEYTFVSNSSGSMAITAHLSASVLEVA